jgi:hypothetical protein
LRNKQARTTTNSSVQHLQTLLQFDTSAAADHGPSPTSAVEWDPEAMKTPAIVLLLAPALILAKPALAADKHDPCSFLKPSEVEGATGPLAGPPYRSSGTAPSQNGRDCRYETPDRRSIRVEVQWDGGKNFMSMLGSTQAMVESAGLKGLKLMDGSTVAGHWDQAALNSCCEFNALKGDQLVTVDVSGSKATIEQAASLADAAIQRLDQPLDIKGDTGIKAAQDRAALRPKPRDVCDLLTQADAEAIAGKQLSESPEGNNRSCTYTFPLNAQMTDYDIKLMVVWRGGFSEMRTSRTAVGNASSMLGMNMVQKPAGAEQVSGLWDELSNSIIGVAAVKGDVMVSVEGGPIRQDIQQAFVEKALAI